MASEIKPRMESNRQPILDLSKEKKIRILVDCGSLANGMGAPEASLQLIQAIKKRCNFKGKFEFVLADIPEQSLIKQSPTLAKNLDKLYRSIAELEKNNPENGIISIPYTGQRLGVCNFGFTGAFDIPGEKEERSKVQNLYLEQGMGCKYFSTLSTQGWKTFKDPEWGWKGVISESERVNPNVFIQSEGGPSTRMQVSVHLPRQDVLLVENEEASTIQAKKTRDSKKQLEVILYKLDQPKNHLQTHRKLILNALQKHAQEERIAIKVTEYVDSPQSDSASYPPLTIVGPTDTLPAAYHRALASSHLVFCEGQSTASQSMLYGTVVCHIPLKEQGVNIHCSNLEVAKIKKEVGTTPGVDVTEETAYTIKMSKRCEEMRETARRFTIMRSSALDSLISVEQEKLNTFVKEALDPVQQRAAISIARRIRGNEKEDMFNACMLEIAPHYRPETPRTGAESEPADLAARLASLSSTFQSLSGTPGESTAKPLTLLKEVAKPPAPTSNEPEQQNLAPVLTSGQESSTTTTPSLPMGTTEQPHRPSTPQ